MPHISAGSRRQKQAGGTHLLYRDGGLPGLLLVQDREADGAGGIDVGVEERGSELACSDDESVKGSDWARQFCERTLGRLRGVVCERASEVRGRLPRKREQRTIGESHDELVHAVCPDRLPTNRISSPGPSPPHQLERRDRKSVV